jgi:signal transduction histidine kinase
MSYRLLTFFDWALIATSLFNTVTLLWLGLTVLLNAERRSWGTFLAGGGLLVGAAFFVGHTAVVGRVIGTFSDEMELWWRLGWAVMAGAPYLWYVVMAWYSGALRRPGARGLLGAVSALGLLALGLLLFADPLPSYGAVLARSPAPLFATPAFGRSLTTVALVYPVYSVCCILLALVVLRHPGASARFMGDEARRRARPWLIAASLLLLAVSLAVALAAAWVLQQARQGELPGLSPLVLTAIILFDLLLSLLVAGAVVLIGQAVVAYEVFTGTALPRGELRRQWRRALILAAGYGLAVGWSMSGAGIPGQPIYQLLLATVLTTVFFALLSWRSFRERRVGLGRLRPFVGRRGLYAGLLGHQILADDADPAAPLRALCDELLNAEAAFLVPVGPLAALAGPPLALPSGATPPVEAALALAAGLPATPPLVLPVAPEGHGGAAWALPLSDEQGLVGLLLLGAKRDGGLYTEEEMALARAAAEGLLDSRAAAEMGRRLVAIQRRRLAEGQVLDRRARRLLHDEVLPQIHGALLQIAEQRLLSGATAPGAERLRPAIDSLQAAHRQISDLLHELPPAAGPELERHGPLGALRRAVERELPGAFECLRWELDPAAEAAARALDPLRAETLYYAAREAVRNAARHGRGGDEARPLALRVAAVCRAGPDGRPAVEVAVEDDGVGLAAGGRRAGAGAGLALHETILALLGGAIVAHTPPTGGTRVVVNLPAEPGASAQ